MGHTVGALVDRTKLNVSFTYQAFTKQLALIGFDRFEAITTTGSERHVFERWSFIGKPGVLEFQRLRPGDRCDELAVSRACKIIGISNSASFWSEAASVTRFPAAESDHADYVSVIGSGYHDIIRRVLSLMGDHPNKIFSGPAIIRKLDLSKVNADKIDSILVKLRRKELIHRMSAGGYMYGPMSIAESRSEDAQGYSLSSSDYTQFELISKLVSLGFHHRNVHTSHWGEPATLLVAPNGYISILLEARDPRRGANNVELKEIKSLLGLGINEDFWQVTELPASLRFRASKVIKTHLPNEQNYKAGSVARLLDSIPNRIFTRNEIEVLANISDSDITNAITTLSAAGRITYIRSAKLTYISSLDIGNDTFAPKRKSEAVTLSIKFGPQPVVSMVASVVDKIPERDLPTQEPIAISDRLFESNTILKPIDILSEYFPDFGDSIRTPKSEDTLKRWLKATEALIKVLED